VLSFPILMLGGGVLAVLALMVFAVGGPNASKASNRRLESVRERHSKSNEVAAQAQLKRILQSRTQTKMDGLAQRLIPNPALLRRRLHQTGRTWTLAQYGLVSLGIIVVVSLALILKGLPVACPTSSSAR
jgi:tight adherence protein B